MCGSDRHHGVAVTGDSKLAIPFILLAGEEAEEGGGVRHLECVFSFQASQNGAVELKVVLCCCCCCYC